ncbi:MAG TPA: hypothetical protein DHV59_15450 [Oxalobacteraceae bacterium]|nr:hypothetical protein [Oxalobacteraceae bacterium]
MENNQKPISQIMSRTLCQVSTDQTAMEALMLMRDKSISSVLVVEDNAILGIITERDIVRAVNSRLDFQTMSCIELMQSPVLSVSPETPCLDAYQKMASRGIRHLGVTDEAGKVLGLASEGDLMRDFSIEYFMNFKDIGSVMSSEFCTLGEAALVTDAVRLMIERHQSCVVIIDEQRRPIGILTERDVVRLCSEHANSDSLMLREVMHAPVCTAKPRDLLHESVKSMAAKQIRRLVVVDHDGAVSGLLTHHEVVRGLKGSYAAFFKALADAKSGGQAQAKPQVDEKLILATLLRAKTGTAVLTADIDYRICYATPSVSDVLRLDPQKILGADLRETMQQAGWPDFPAIVVKAAVADGAQVFEATAGGMRAAMRVLLMRDAEDRACGFLVLVEQGMRQ